MIQSSRYESTRGRTGIEKKVDEEEDEEEDDGGEEDDDGDEGYSE